MRVERTRSELKIVAPCSTPVFGWTSNFTHQCSCEFDAILLQENINRRLEEKLKSLITEAYNMGNKDAKAKRKKKKEFWINLSTFNWGGC